jgi:hypothetical protein
MVNLRGFPAKKFTDLGFRTRGEAIQDISAHGKTGRHFDTWEEVEAYLLTISPGEPLKKIVKKETKKKHKKVKKTDDDEE